MSANYSRSSAPSIRSVSSSHSQRLPPRQDAIPAKIRRQSEADRPMSPARTLPYRPVHNHKPQVHNHEEIDRARPPIPPEPPNTRTRSRPVRTGTVSLSSEDFEGPRTAHDARPEDTRLERVRASTWTQTSGATASSTLYPPSSSEATGTESPPDPTTPTESSVAEAVHNDEDDVYNRYQLDPDDVSYRLRLLVRNNYYLPPAHSKPLHASLRQGTTNATSPSKSSSPTIMGLFRLGSSKPRGVSTAPTSPIPQGILGARRTIVHEHHPTPIAVPSLPQRSLSADTFPEKERKGRVVVIRERLNDSDDKVPIADHKGKGDKSISENKPKDTLVDPTGVVDLPAYAFEPQASIGNVLGRQSMGADALVEFLPSSRLRHGDVQDEAWRRALLAEAVDHSMSSIPDVVDNTPSDAPQSVPPSPVRTSPHADIGRPIIRPGDSVLSALSVGPEDSSSTSPEIPPANLRGPKGLERPGLPIRANMSLAPLHPLPPPPRKKPKTPPVRNIAADNAQFTDAMPRQTIRKTLSTPLLSEAYARLSPPPLPLASPELPRISAPGLSLPSRDTDESLSSGSYYSEDDDPGSQRMPRASFASMDDSMVFSNRPSLTASHWSHISSAFGGPPSPSLFPGGSTIASRADTPSNRSSLAQRRAQSPRALTLSSGSNLLRHSDTVQEQDEKTPTIAVAAYALDSEDGAATLYVNPRSRAVSNTSSTKTPRIIAHPVTGSSGASTTNIESVTSSSTGLHHFTPQPFESLDRRKPVTNTPTAPNARLFSPRSMASKRSPRIPESTFELLKHTHDVEGPLEQDGVTSNMEHDVSVPSDVISMWARDQGQQDLSGKRALDGLLKLHIEAEKDHMRRIASNLRK